ncbi:MAG: hypothetical protein H6662_15680 [Ardenticatenaceae bacterium]|nr:hypothetical protein [Anaerolineales bacterium]MCB8923028.1 hypothetical protein [Ardenticatenaceae bacterium]
MKEQIEGMSAAIDAVLKAYKITDKVAGGYVAGNGILFSLTGTAYINDIDETIAQVLQHIFLRPIKATVGVIMVGGPLFARPRMDFVEGEIVPAELETVSILTLMAQHRQPQLGGGAGH